MILDEIRDWITLRVKPWLAEKGVPLPTFALEEPPAGVDGDLACNLALLLAKPLRQSPRSVAQEIQSLLNVGDRSQPCSLRPSSPSADTSGGPVSVSKRDEQHTDSPLATAGNDGRESELVSKCSIAGAGFLNFKVSAQRLVQELQDINARPETYGALKTAPSEKILLEFVSANPTGPLHVGHGRGAALGDSLGLILAHLGYQVTREYYINDAGNQVQLLGQSVVARALELEGKTFSMPEEGYHGDYIKPVASEFLKTFPGSQDTEQATAFALRQLQKKIEIDLADFGVQFGSWFSEADIVRKGLVEKYVEILRSRGAIQEYDDAIWFVRPEDRSAEEPKDKDRVLKRRDGRWTYFATDVAYHANKFERGFDRLIDIWGADHHGYVQRVKGSMEALGHDPQKLHVLLYQLVSLSRAGVPVSMSKRSGDFVTLREVLDEVGKDACRFFFALRGPNTTMDFDLELAKKHTNDNPVYYLQYAHARICSIFRQASEKQASETRSGGAPEADLLLLKEKEERDLIKRLSFFPHTLSVCAHEDSPHPLANYLLSLCRQFHHFYDHHRVLGVEFEVTQARLALLDAVRHVLRLGLKLLGVSAPEAM